MCAQFGTVRIASRCLEATDAEKAIGEQFSVPIRDVEVHKKLYTAAKVTYTTALVLKEVNGSLKGIPLRESVENVLAILSRENPPIPRTELHPVLQAKIRKLTLLEE